MLRNSGECPLPRRYTVVWDGYEIRRIWMPVTWITKTSGNFGVLDLPSLLSLSLSLSRSRENANTGECGGKGREASATDALLLQS